MRRRMIWGEAITRIVEKRGIPVEGLLAVSSAEQHLTEFSKLIHVSWIYVRGSFTIINPIFT